MANVEMQLISRIVRTGDLATAMDWGVTDHDFKTNEALSVWRYVTSYYANQQTSGSVLGEHAFAVIFPQLVLYDDPSMTTAALCYEVRRSRIISEVKQSMLTLSDTVEVDPAVAIAEMNAHLQQLLALGDSKNHDMSFSDAMSKLLNRYATIKENKFAFSKITWPWEVMNDVTGGIQDDDYIILYGRPKSMKTWVLTAIIAWAFQQEKTALIYTKEMTQENIYQRVAACVARLPYHELRNGKLMPHDEMLLSSLAAHTRDQYSRANLICLDGRKVSAGGDTVAWLQSKVEKYKPDIVFVDGMYLLSDAAVGKRAPADWQRVTNISRAIRSMILATRIPVVATMQANRGAAKHSDGNLDEIAYADAVAQDATMAIRVMNEKNLNTIACKIAGSREFALHGFRLHGIPATNFEFHSVMSEAEVNEVEKHDAPEADKKKDTKRTPRTRATQVIDDTDRAINEQMKTV